MKLSFLIVSYTVLTKYCYCYEVPKDVPIRYFDGNDWKIMKPLSQFRLIASRRPNISLDWSGLSNEQDNKSEESTTTDTSTAASSDTTAMTSTTTTPTTTTQPTTTPTTTTTKKETTTTATTKKCPVCPTIATTTTKKKPMIIKLVTKKPPTKTTKRTTERTTRKATFKPLWWIHKPAPPVVFPHYPPGLMLRSGPETSQQALPENWQDIMKNLTEAIKMAEAQKNISKFDAENTTNADTDNLQASSRKATGEVEDLMTILMDGIEIDDRPDDEEENASQDSVLLGFEHMLGQDGSLELDTEASLTSSKQRDISNDEYVTLRKVNAQDLDFKSYLDALKGINITQNYDIPYDTGTQSKKDDGTLQEIKNNQTEKVDETLQESEIKAYLDVLKSKYEMKRPSEKINTSFYNMKDKDIRKYLNIVKENYDKQTKDVLEDFTFNLNEIEDPIAANDTHDDEITKESDSKDILPNTGMKSFFDVIMNRHLKKPNITSDNNDFIKYFNSNKDIFSKEEKKEANGELDLNDTQNFIETNRTDESETKNRTKNEDIDMASYLNTMTAKYAIQDGEDEGDNLLGIDNLLVEKDSSQDNDLLSVLNAINVKNIGKDTSQNEDILLDLDSYEISPLKSDKEYGIGVVENEGLENISYGQYEANNEENKTKIEETSTLQNFKYALDDKEQNDRGEENLFPLEDNSGTFKKLNSRRLNALLRNRSFQNRKRNLRKLVTKNPL